MPPPDRKDIAKAFARVFAHGDADLVLGYLRGQTLDQTRGPNTTNDELRHLEGQRFLFKTMLNLIEEGRRNA
ncbi:MAG: hypothetical protein H7Y60_11800 [Rhodospirillaceae bacterium]|nr:hypothetical protein [Rhodospirillales bacterium]